MCDLQFIICRHCYYYDKGRCYNAELSYLSDPAEHFATVVSFVEDGFLHELVEGCDNWDNSDIDFSDCNRLGKVNQAIIEKKIIEMKYKLKEKIVEQIGTKLLNLPKEIEVSSAAVYVDDEFYCKYFK